MFAGAYPEELYVPPSPIDKVPYFYLKNKNQFEISIGRNLENRISKGDKNEIVILGTFCELVGPIPLLVTEKNHSSDHIDKLVLQAMSSDYQACELGDFSFNKDTQRLHLSNTDPHFVYYFMLWDIQARGYVRPCCIITCSNDAVRIRHLFEIYRRKIKFMLMPLMENNTRHFYIELNQHLRSVAKMIKLQEDGELKSDEYISPDYLQHLYSEYTNLVTQIEEATSYNIKDFTTEIDVNVCIDSAFFLNKRKSLRSIYEIMSVTEADMQIWLNDIKQEIQCTETPKLFKLKTSESNQLIKSLEKDRSHYFSILYFQSAIFGFEQNKVGHECQNKDSFGFINDFRKKELKSLNYSQCPLSNEYIFPELAHLNNWVFFSSVIKKIDPIVVIKLMACMFSQFHLVVLLEHSDYHVIRFFSCLLPRSQPIEYCSPSTEWPTLNQISNSGITFLLKNPAYISNIPDNIKKFISVFDYSNGQYRQLPHYDKGYISQFMDSFRGLDYDHNHLDLLINILITNYVDLVYQWCSLLPRKDRRRIMEYLFNLGNVREDVLISERLALYIMRRLAMFTMTTSTSTSAEANDDLNDTLTSMNNALGDRCRGSDDTTMSIFTTKPKKEPNSLFTNRATYSIQSIKDFTLDKT